VGFSRTLEPEILDLLAADDPRARASRGDLVRLNFVMRQQTIMANLLRSLAPPRRLADLGCGDGRFLLGVARRMAPHWPQVTVLIVDQQDIVSAPTRAGFAALGWRCESVTGDIFAALPRLDADVITANLFLHHLAEPLLRQLLSAVAEQARGFVACEPRRSQAALLASRLVFALACNDVTRHDAVASVRAGFAGRELSRLWPAAGWQRREGLALPFTHFFAAHCSSDKGDAV
jgi:SAM-dependent methyltransferase